MSKTKRKPNYKRDDDDDDLVIERHMRGIYNEDGDYYDECTTDNHERDGRIIRKRILDA